MRERVNTLHLGLFLSVFYLLWMNEIVLTIPIFFKYIILISCVCLLGSVALKKISQINYVNKISLFVLFLLLFVIGVRINKVGQLLLFFLIVIAVRHERLDKIIIPFFRANLLVCLISVLFSLIGFIPNQAVDSLSHESIGMSFSSERYTFGYFWPTDFASHVFFILLMHFYMNRNKIKSLHVVVYFFISLFVLKFTDARLGSGLILILALLSFAKGLNLKLNFTSLYVILLPIILLMSVIVVLLYDEGNMFWIVLDDMMSSRLNITSGIYNRYGVSFLGNSFEMVGGGAEGEYSFVDSSFWQLVLIYGILYSGVFFCMIFLSVFYAYKWNDNDLLLVFVLGMLSGAFAQHFIQVFMNPFVLSFQLLLSTERVVYKRGECVIDKRKILEKMFKLKQNAYVSNSNTCV